MGVGFSIVPFAKLEEVAQQKNELELEGNLLQKTQDINLLMKRFEEQFRKLDAENESISFTKKEKITSDELFVCKKIRQGDKKGFIRT